MWYQQYTYVWILDIYDCTTHLLYLMTIKFNYGKVNFIYVTTKFEQENLACNLPEVYEG